MITPEQELGFRYVLDKSGDSDVDENKHQYTASFGGHFSPRKNTSKLPVSFLKLKLQRNMRQ